MQYIRLSEGLTKYKLIPDTENIWDHIQSNEKDYYKSIFKYNEDHYKQWQATKTVAGIKNVVTNSLFFDFDNAQDPEAARQDAIQLTTRLLSSGIKQDNIQIAFSGLKGYSVEVETDFNMTQEEFKNVTFALASDLPSFDRVVNDPQRIARVIATKHNKSGLYKFPLTVTQLEQYTVTKTRELAANLDNIDGTIMDSWVQVQLPASISKLAVPKAKEKKVVEVEQHDLNLSLKPKWISDAKYALQEGYFLAGERNVAFMVLASTYKNQGFSKGIVYRLLKGVAEAQAARSGQDRYADEELWNNITEVIFSPNWKGGTYSYDNTPLLQEVTKRLGLKVPKTEDEPLVNVDSVTGIFKKFAQDIDTNTIKLGIPAIDKHVRVTTSMLVGLLAAPSGGKCLGKGTEIRMFSGELKKVEDIVVGDYLMGDDSLPRKVKSVCRGSEELYRVDQLNGDSYVVNKSHILSLKSSANFTDKFKNDRFSKVKFKDVEVSDYLNWSKSMKKYYKGYKVGVEYSNKELSISPYIMGLWLGDGTSDKPQITTADKVTQDFIVEYFKQFKLGTKIYNNITYTFTTGIKKFGINKFTNELKKYNVLRNKHIPNDFLINSRSNRLQLLAGIIDSDGSLSKTKNTYEVTFKNERLMDNLVELCRSLGFRATKSKKLAKYKSFTKGKLYQGEANVFRAYIAGDNLHEIPCKLDRKRIVNPKTKNTDTLSSSIKLVPLGVGDYYGFEIDGNKRFLLKDFTVTHNTTLSLNVMNSCSAANNRCVFFSLDMGAPLVFQRLIQKHTNLNSNKIFDIYKNNDEKEIARIEKVISDEYKNVKFCFKSGVTVDNIREYLINYQQETGEKVRLVVIDYLECLSGQFSDATANTALISQQLKDIANELELTILLLLQPQKHAGDPSEELLSMRSIKGSSAIEQACSIIFTVWRPGFNPKNIQDDRFMSIAVVKNRMGQLGSFDFGFNGLNGELRELDSEEMGDLDDIRKRKALEKASSDI